jgi:hypothetical protein
VSIRRSGFAGGSGESRRSSAQDDCPDHHVELVDETRGQQVVPERAAAEHQDLAAGRLLELDNLLVRR